jgi:hypothetical protein
MENKKYPYGTRLADLKAQRKVLKNRLKHLQAKKEVAPGNMPNEKLHHDYDQTYADLIEIGNLISRKRLSRLYVRIVLVVFLIGVVGWLAVFNPSTNGLVMKWFNQPQTEKTHQSKTDAQKAESYLKKHGSSGD